MWVQSVDPSEKLLYLYLLTNTLTNIAGVYKIENRRISFDTGFTEEAVKYILEKFEKAGKVYRIGEYIAIPAWPKHQKWEEKIKIKEGIISILQEIPKDIFAALSEVNYSFDLSIVNKIIIAYKQRKNISGTKAKLVKEKSGNKCAVCGSDGKLVIRHIKPLEKGGTNNIENLQAVCEGCHKKINKSKKVHIPYVDKNGHENQSKKVPNYSDSDSDSDLIFSGSEEPHDTKNQSKQTPSKPKKPPLREREPVNDYERVEKAYLLNWDALFSQNKVKTPDPVINWNQTRALLKKHFETLKPEIIIQAVNNGLKNDWIMSKGYSLSMMLSMNMINDLINGGNGTTGRGPPVSKHQREKQFLG
jgi:hypothetical protein